MTDSTVQKPPIVRNRRRQVAPDRTTVMGQGRFTAYLFSAPAIALVGAILIYPLLYGLYTSLFNSERLGAPQEFVGLDNYVQMFQNPAFTSALRRTAIFVFGCLVLGLTLGMLFAFALNRLVARLRFLRALTIVPYILSPVAAAVMFRILFNGDFGMINRVIEWFGIDGPRWLSNPVLAMTVVIVAQVWTDLPLTVLLLLAGLQTIDNSYLDAALVDGATGWRRAWHISIPLITPQVALSTVFLSYATLTSLGVILALTGGGPLKATQTLPMEIYNTAFQSLRFNDALAMATVVLFLNAVLTLIYVRLARRFRVDD